MVTTTDSLMLERFVRTVREFLDACVDADGCTWCDRQLPHAEACAVGRMAEALVAYLEAA